MELTWSLDGNELVGKINDAKIVATIGTVPRVKVNHSKVGLELPSGYGCIVCDKDAWITGPKFSDMRYQCPKAKSWCEAMISLLYTE